MPRLRCSPQHLSLAMAMLVACARAAPLVHAFSPEVARNHYVDVSEKTPVSERALLLLPDKITMYNDHRSWLQSAFPEPVEDEIRGPARVFFAPGRRSYVVSLPSSANERHEMAVKFTLEADGIYEFRIRETEDSFSWEIMRVSPESYRRIDPPLLDAAQ